MWRGRWRRTCLVKGLPASPHLAARHHPWPGQPDHEPSHSGRYGAARRTDGLTATRECVPKEDEMTQTIEEKNKAFALEAFETLFNKKDYAAAERFWSPNYIQHRAHVPPGREGLFALVNGIPDILHYESGLTVANGDYVLLHGRFSGMGLPANW